MRHRRALYRFENTGSFDFDRQKKGSGRYEFLRKVAFPFQSRGARSKSRKEKWRSVVVVVVVVGVSGLKEGRMNGGKPIDVMSKEHDFFLSK